MKWRELSNAAGGVLERCWSLHRDNPTIVRVNIGDTLYGGFVFTEEAYREILRYKIKQEIESEWDADFEVKRIGDTVVCRGLKWRKVEVSNDGIPKNP